MVVEGGIVSSLLFCILVVLFFYMFVNGIIAQYHFVKVKGILEEKYKRRYGKKFGVYAMLSEAEVKLHFDKDSEEYKVSMKQAVALKRATRAIQVSFAIFALSLLIGFAQGKVIGA